MKFIATFVLGLIIGISIMKLTTPSIQAPSCSEPKVITKTKIETACYPVVEKVDKKKITDAFLLFLASIGYKDAFRAPIEKIVENPEGFKPPKLEPNKLTTHRQEPKSKKAHDFFKNIREIFPSDEISMGEIQIAQHRLLDDPTIYHARSKYIEKPEEIIKVNGLYVGDFFRLAGAHKGKVEEVNLTINFIADDKGKIDGSFSMKLIRDDKLYSNARGEGGNGDIRTNPSDSKSIIIEASPTTFFHFFDANLTQANVYENGEFVGIARLRKTN